MGSDRMCAVLGLLCPQAVCRAR